MHDIHLHWQYLINLWHWTWRFNVLHNTLERWKRNGWNETVKKTVETQQNESRFNVIYWLNIFSLQNPSSPFEWLNFLQVMSFLYPWPGCSTLRVRVISRFFWHCYKIQYGTWQREEAICSCHFFFILQNIFVVINKTQETPGIPFLCQRRFGHWILSLS